MKFDQAFGGVQGMRILGLFLAAFAAILIFTGCESNGGYHVAVGTTPPPPPPVVIVHEDNHKHGPPPHAPAHGYRAKHDGCDMVYDGQLGVYSVVGYRDYYYEDGFFFRFGGSGWEVSAHVGGSGAHWEACAPSRVPTTLVVKYEGDRGGHGNGGGPGKGHGRGNGKGKGKGNPHSSLLFEAPSFGAEPYQEARWGKY
jgi:hypothetical protein